MQDMRRRPAPASRRDAARGQRPGDLNQRREPDVFHLSNQWRDARGKRIDESGAGFRLMRSGVAAPPPIPGSLLFLILIGSSDDRRLVVLSGGSLS
jgi:hypothetical protein